MIWSPVSKPLTREFANWNLNFPCYSRSVIAFWCDCKQEKLFYCVSFQLFITLGVKGEKKGKNICSVNTAPLISFSRVSVWAQKSSERGTRVTLAAAGRGSGRISRAVQTEICLLGNGSAEGWKAETELQLVCVWRPAPLGWSLVIWNSPRFAACTLPAAVLPLSSLQFQQWFNQYGGEDRVLVFWRCLDRFSLPGLLLRSIFRRCYWESGVCICMNWGWQIPRNLFCAVWALPAWSGIQHLPAVVTWCLEPKDCCTWCLSSSSGVQQSLLKIAHKSWRFLWTFSKYIRW